MTRPATAQSEAPPASVETEPIDSRGAPPGAPEAAGPPAPPIEITVQGERRARDGSALTRREAQKLPGAFGDPFRAVESMPGVTSVASGLPYFYVRGAPPGNVGYFVDGIRVPVLYHAFAGPSVIHPAFIERVELHRGGYPARLGRYAGGIVEANTVSPFRELRGEASVRAIDAGAMGEAPFAGRRGTLLLGGRYSYTAALVSLLAPLQLKYWDYQALASYELGSSDTLSLFAFGAFDYAATDEEVTVVGVEFHRLDLRYDHRFDESSSLRAAVTLGRDRSRAENGDLYTFSRIGVTPAGEAGGSLRDDLIAARVTLEHEPSDSLAIHAGLDAARDHLELDINPNLIEYPVLSRWFPSRNDDVVGAFTEFVFRPSNRVETRFGVRADLYRSLGNEALAAEPRVAATFDISRWIRILHSFGLAHQPPSYAPPGIPGTQQVAGLQGGLQKALQASSGVEVSLPAELVASASVFDQILLDLTDPIGTTGEFDLETADTRSLGSAQGLEVSLRRPLSRRLGGFLNATLSRSRRSHDTVESLAAYDRMLVANAAVAYELGAQWRVGARIYYQSGVPVREPSTAGPVYDSSRRAPGFFRLDLRGEKRWRLGQRGQIAVVAEVLNSTLSREVLRRNCNPTGCQDAAFGPLVLPSLGVEVAY